MTDRNRLIWPVVAVVCAGIVGAGVYFGLRDRRGRSGNRSTSADSTSRPGRGSGADVGVPGADTPPRRMTDRQIETILTRDLDIPSRPRGAADSLDKARRYYDDFPQQPEAMYMAVKHFQIYLAYAGMKGFPDVENQKLYHNARHTLVDTVTEAYLRAWKEFKNEDWDASLRDFQEVLRMIPVQDEPYPDKDNELFANVRRYIMLIRDKTAEKPQRRF